MITFRMGIVGDVCFGSPRHILVCKDEEDVLYLAQQSENDLQWVISQEGEKRGVTKEFCDAFCLVQWGSQYHSKNLKGVVLSTIHFNVKVDKDGKVIERDGRPPTEAENAREAMLTKAVFGEQK